MVRIVEFDPAHCEGAEAHPSQAHHQRMFDNPGSFREVWKTAYSALDPVFLRENAQIFQTGLADPDEVAPEDRMLFQLLLLRQLPAVVLLSRSKDALGNAIISFYHDRIFGTAGGAACLHDLEGSIKEQVLEAFRARSDRGPSPS